MGKPSMFSDEFKFRVVVAVFGTLPIILTLIAVLMR
jgi:hypothetical protein